MTISYNWLSEYLPVKIESERLSHILTSVGLEVESMEPFDEVKGGLKGLVIGEVLEAAQHPNADKLTVTKVNVGKGEPLQIVCGAPNVAAGQKVVVATVGTTIYPVTGDPLTMKVAKIRGVESYGMICAEDEVGLGHSHAGIIVLPQNAEVGKSAPDFFKPYSDVIYEIGLTPNRADAMSHWGVARDVCAYLSHHEGKELRPVIPQTNFSVDENKLQIQVEIENSEACPRYSGVCLSNVRVNTSPKWLQEKLKAIGLRPINNIVDITNFIQHETGQPLHAFDYDQIKGHKVVVKTLPEGTPFVTLDEKERKLSAQDLMICDEQEGMCIAGVFGGLHSGVTDSTTNIFLESAFFDPTYIRKTSFRHGLRTDAATRFEKGIDLSHTVIVLKRAALLIKELAGGTIASQVVDVYPSPQPKKQVHFSYAYLKKLSGKEYAPAVVKGILQSLGFSITTENNDGLVIDVPYHKRDVSMQADLVEEILRIDGLDNIEIPSRIMLSPAVEENYKEEKLKEKISNVLTGLGFTEILTNSITNSAYFSDEETTSMVKLLNNLSNELNALRPTMLPTALEVIGFNGNRKNNDLKLFEFGKTYSTSGQGQYSEQQHLCLYSTGKVTQTSWKGKGTDTDLYYLKGITEAVLKNLGIATNFAESEGLLSVSLGREEVVRLGKVATAMATKFDIKQPVFFADFNWNRILKFARTKVQFKEISKFPAVERDLSMIVPKATAYKQIQEGVQKLRLKQLKDVKLFDVFQSEKLGADKKSLAVNFIFQDEEKTLTDKEIDSWMNKIMSTLEKELQAEIRKG